MTTHQSELQNEGRNPLILIGGAILLIVALVLVLFGGNLLGDNTTVPEPAPAVADESAAPAVTLPESGPPLQIGDRPYEFALQNLQGETVRLSQFIGQPILINFWATWCGPCRIEMPEMQAAFEAYKEDGFVILALDQDETAPEVEAYFDELGLTFTPLLDVNSETAANYGLRSTLPSSVFINPAGEVAVIHRGVMTRGQLEGFLAEIIPEKPQS
ncbi:MAG: TlpA disulfide reductase family protein [Candidatus Promineifilaceae bacterium]|nr:TlpA disulfide reductase family protein [Candidatus Promineifilaceae bacterium]